MKVRAPATTSPAGRQRGTPPDTTLASPDPIWRRLAPRAPTPRRWRRRTSPLSRPRRSGRLSCLTLVASSSRGATECTRRTSRSSAGLRPWRATRTLRFCVDRHRHATPDTAGRSSLLGSPFLAAAAFPSLFLAPRRRTQGDTVIGGKALDDNSPFLGRPPVREKHPNLRLLISTVECVNLESFSRVRKMEARRGARPPVPFRRASGKGGASARATDSSFGPLLQFFTSANPDAPFPEGEDDLFCFMARRVFRCSCAALHSLGVCSGAVLTSVVLCAPVSRRRSRRAAATSSSASAGSRCIPSSGSRATRPASPLMTRSPDSPRPQPRRPGPLPAGRSHSLPRGRWAAAASQRRRRPPARSPARSSSTPSVRLPLPSHSVPARAAAPSLFLPFLRRPLRGRRRPQRWPRGGECVPAPRRADRPRRRS